jgi:muramoyltetrapeptide carboxypeptidase
LFFAAPLEKQCEDLKNALESEANVLWCLRGGWGSMRLLPFLDTLTPPKKPKLLIGFSDITSLHLFFTQKWNWPTLHGRTISQLSLNWSQNEEQEVWKKVITGELKELNFNKLQPLNAAAKKTQIIKSTLTGGNLRMVQSSIGTPWQIDVKNKILFLEDVSERGYSVDRMFEQMLQMNLLKQDPAAVIFGSFTEGLEKNGEDLIPKALERFAQKVDYPVLSGLPCGHGVHQNYPLPFNTEASLRISDEIKLICKTGAEIF